MNRKNSPFCGYDTQAEIKQSLCHPHGVKA